MEIIKEMAVMIMLSVMVVMVLSVGVLSVKRYQCLAMWGDSGMQCRWTVMSGCMVQVDGGAWIPSSSYRMLHD